LTSTAEDNTSLRIAGLLEQAKTQRGAGHLVRPFPGSALASYREILVLNADHAEARAGIERIKGLLVDDFHAAVKKQDLASAQRNLADLRTVADDTAELKKLELELNSLNNAYAPALVAAANRRKEMQAPPRTETTESRLPGKPADGRAIAARAEENALVQRTDDALKAIADRLKERALVKQRQGELAESQALIAEGLRVQPEHGGLKRLQRAIEHQLQSQAAQRSVVTQEANREPDIPSTAEVPQAPPVKTNSATLRDPNMNFGTF
jgi:hypothetical protein